MKEEKWMNKNRNHTIDMIKGIAIILVVITHYQWTIEERKIFVFPFIINMAIPVFMIITGYLYSLSLQKQKIQHIEDAYRWRTILKRTIRYTAPVVTVIIWELLNPHISTSPSLLWKLKWTINGTYGSGNYYYPVMMQLVFVFPLIYFVIEKNKEKGLLFCFIANAIYELLVWAYDMNTQCYRLLMFRYVFLIAAGVYAFKGYKIRVWLGLLVTFVGAAFISAITYFEYVPRIVNKDWATTNFISSMFIIPLMIIVLQNVKIRFAPLEIIGQASYHVFLAQMVYYLGYYFVLQKLFPSRKVHFIGGIVVSIIIGVLFYYIDKPIQNYLGKLIMTSTSSCGLNNSSIKR